MATKCQNGMKVKSKSESCQNRTKIPAKYRSMTLRRQDAKLDVTTTGTPEASFLYDTETSIAEDENEITESESPSPLNRSIMNKTFRGVVNLFVTPNKKKLTSSTSVNERILSRKRSFVHDSSVQNMQRSISVNNQNLMYTKPQSSSLTTLNSTDTGYESSKANISCPSEKYFTIDGRNLGSKHVSQKSLRDKKLLYGVKQFNLDAKNGLEYLSKSGILNKTSAKEVALFLFREGRLSKKQIGVFIGGHHDFNQQVLSEIVMLHEFTHLILVQALRQFLWSFRLPGEAMQIDRIMEAFAKHYCRQNPNLFEETDTCYLLSFSIIMLNTALHNKNVKIKITCEQFVAQNRGINSGKDLPRDILELIYKNIKEEPFKIPDETYDDLMYTFFSPEKEGWLLKQGGSWKNWKRRWFLLSDRCLYYFQHTAENVPKGIIPLENVKVRLMEDKDGKRFLFEVYSETNATVKGCKTDSKGTVVQGKHKSYRMSASSQEDRSSWVQSIQDSIKEHDFYDIVNAKKAALRRKSLKHMDHHDIPTNSEPTISS